MDWVGDGMGWVGWDLCAGLFYEHRFAMLITETDQKPHGDGSQDQS